MVIRYIVIDCWAERERETERLPYSWIDVWVREGKYSSREREKEIFTHLVR